jgi:hypothetical protein
MPKSRPLSKQDILAAMSQTKSNRSSARYLNCSYIHYKKWAKLYEATDSSFPNLFEQHKNQSGKGIPKFLSNTPFGRKEPCIQKIIDGTEDPSPFNPQKIKHRMIQQGYLKEECGTCGFHECRTIDGKTPLILHFKDNNKKHWEPSNLQMLCYNCYFLYHRNIFNDKQLEKMEDHLPTRENLPTWEVDEYTQKRLEELGLYDVKIDNDPYDLVSRNKERKSNNL